VDGAGLPTPRTAGTGAVAVAGRGGMTYLVPLNPDFDRTQNKNFVEALRQRTNPSEPAPIKRRILMESGQVVWM
jgi:ABC-type branched-subunit amino acid transport system substrate-binding protein